MTSFLYNLLFKLEPEHAHEFAMRSLQIAHQTHLLKLFYSQIHNPRTVMGLTFPNPVGLAAGLDKNADYIDALADLGFGFIEIGTVTEDASREIPTAAFPFNERKSDYQSHGIYGKGVEHVEARLKKPVQRYLRINIGKNKDTPLDKALDDYLIGFRRLYPYASYITVNISSPNTPGLRDLQQGNLLNDLLSALKQEQANVHAKENKYIPLVVKISPDLSLEELQELTAVLLQQSIDGVIATNTTISREGVEDSIFAKEAGGLSGAPLDERNTRIIRELHKLLNNKIPIIAVGGIMDEVSAKNKFNAGATLLQLYTGFIYAGPRIIKSIAKIC